MENLIVIVMLGMLLLIIYQEVFTQIHLFRLRKRGLYPRDEKHATISDVEHLLKNGERIFAIRLYRKTNPGCSLSEACRKVAQLENQLASSEIDAG